MNATHSTKNKAAKTGCAARATFSNIPATMKISYIARDSTGWALQFTGKGKSVQCSTIDADRFATADDAQASLDRAEEFGGTTEWIGVPLAGEVDGATDADGVETMMDQK